MPHVFFIGLLSLFACTNAGPLEVSFPVTALGQDATPTTVGAWTVQLTRAEVGFGPAYFCAGVSAAGELCRAALAEFADSHAINALSPEPQPLGFGAGETGTVRSVTYDFAISWTLTQNSPTSLAGAPQGHSAILEGTATRGADVLNFRTSLALAPQFAGARAVESAPVRATLSGSEVALDVVVRPLAWASVIPFDAVFASSGGAPLVTLLPGSPAYEAIRLAMMVNAPPQLTWHTP
ncbi:MAG: hypothetical protein ACKVPX_07220 [Myxococcaceae bacterium]